jgi:hypothetical protein
LKSFKQINNKKLDFETSLPLLAAKMLKISKACYIFTCIDENTKKCLNLMNNGKLPAFITDLKIDGNHVINCGFVGKEIGDVLQEIFENVVIGIWPNEKKVLLKELKKIAEKKLSKIS